MCYTLPKIWLGRIQKYWDRIIPSDFPASSSEFSLKFLTEDETNAVKTFESQLGTEESIVLEKIPEGTVVSNYVGTYNVDGTPGELTLLSPEKVKSNNVVALHYNTDTAQWDKIDDIQVIDNYVWGTVDSFSPIAIIEYKKTMHIEDELPGVAASKCKKVLVCEGNNVKISLEDGKVMASDESTGLKIELTSDYTHIVGGSIDGSPIEKTSIYIEGIQDDSIVYKVTAGSHYIGEGFTTVGEVNFTANNCKVARLTGSVGAVRTLKVNFNLDTVECNWVGAGQGFAGVDDSKPTFASRAWIKEINYIFKNVTSELTYCSQNNEYIYIDSTNALIEGGNHGYILCGGSNADTKKSNVVVKDAIVGIFQTTNRGDVADANASFTGCTVANLFIGGDATDSTVTGTTGKLRYEIFAAENDSYNIINGTENGEYLTQEDMQRIVDAIKVSRSANVTISNDLKAALGNKYIIK